MTSKRAELERSKNDCEDRLAEKKEEEDRSGKVLVNLHMPRSAPDVYVNGTKATGPVYVPRGPIVLGTGQEGGGYDQGTLSRGGKKVEVQVAGIQRAPVADQAAKEASDVAFDLSAGPIAGGRHLLWGGHKTKKMDGVVGLRSEVAFPDLVMSESVRMRPVFQYTFEHGPLDVGWTVHSWGMGLKLTAARVLDIALTGGAAHVSDPAYNNFRMLGGFGPELSVGVSHAILNANSRNGPELGLGANVASGVSYWLDSPAFDEHRTLFAPYINVGVALRLRFGQSQPQRPPAESDMVHFKGGPVPVGWQYGARSERPEHVVLLGSFDLDVKEVTVAEYDVCVDAGKCSQPSSAEGCNWDASGRRNHPINCVTRQQASDYCGFVGKRLPTESEWEHAARGSGSRKFPWGDQPPESRPCWSGGGKPSTSTCEVGSHPDDKTPDGVMDLAGNVSEWTGQYCDYLKASCSGAGWVSRGGSYGHDKPEDLRSSARYVPKEAALETVGFRCAR